MMLQEIITPMLSGLGIITTMLQDLSNHLKNHNPHYHIGKIKVLFIVA